MSLALWPLAPDVDQSWQPPDPGVLGMPCERCDDVACLVVADVSWTIEGGTDGVRVGWACIAPTVERARGEKVHGVISVDVPEWDIHALRDMTGASLRECYSWSLDALDQRIDTCILWHADHVWLIGRMVALTGEWGMKPAKALDLARHHPDLAAQLIATPSQHAVAS